MAWKASDTKKRLLEAAKAEFLQYGFENASLRRMAAAVGIAPPSVYNHFSGKEDMLAALVDPVIQRVKSAFQAVDAEKQALVNEGRSADSVLNHRQVMDTVLGFVYDNLEEVKLLLFCAQGTRYEDILDRAARMEADETCRVLENAGYPAFSSDDRETIFLIMRHQYQTYVEAIRQGYSKERTRAYWQTVDNFFAPGWKRLLPLPEVNGPPE